MDTDNRPSQELLESIHSFPGVYQIKAIGRVDQDFEARVIAAVTGEVVSASEFDYKVRATPGGRHVAVTFDVTVQSAEQVRSLYARIGEIDGLLLLL